MIGIHHCGIVVSDLDRSIDFYVNVLGMSLLSEPSSLMSGTKLEHMVETPGAVLRSVLLQAGESVLELHQYFAPGSRPDRPPTPSALGAQHMALLVEDIRVERAAIEARGGEFATVINFIDTGHAAGLRTTFLKDPDGVRVELVEVAYWNTGERARNIAAYWAGLPDRSRQPGA